MKAARKVPLSRTESPVAQAGQGSESSAGDRVPAEDLEEVAYRQHGAPFVRSTRKPSPFPRHGAGMASAGVVGWAARRNQRRDE